MKRKNDGQAEKISNSMKIMFEAMEKQQAMALDKKTRWLETISSYVFLTAPIILGIIFFVFLWTTNYSWKLLFLPLGIFYIIGWGYHLYKDLLMFGVFR